MRCTSGCTPKWAIAMTARRSAAAAAASGEGNSREKGTLPAWPRARENNNKLLLESRLIDTWPLPRGKALIKSILPPNTGTTAGSQMNIINAFANHVVGMFSGMRPVNTAASARIMSQSRRLHSTTMRVGSFGVTIGSGSDGTMMIVVLRCAHLEGGRSGDGLQCSARLTTGSRFGARF
ncbi:unnamed protein product [Cercospora beticola]|nr:unnamed protein product [Cercospora beticola]